MKTVIGEEGILEKARGKNEKGLVRGDRGLREDRRAGKGSGWRSTD